MTIKRGLRLKSWHPSETLTSPLIINCGHSSVNISEVANVYGAKFGNKLRDGIVDGLTEFSDSTIYSTATTVREFLVGVARLSMDQNVSLEVRQFISGVSGNVDFPVDAVRLKATCELFASKVRDPDDTYFYPSRNLKSRDTLIHNLSRFLKFVAPLLGWPSVGTVSGIKRAASLSEGRVLALGELVSGNSPFSIKPRSDDLVPALNAERMRRVRAHCESVLFGAYVTHLERSVGMHLVAFESIHDIREKASSGSKERILTEPGVWINEGHVYQNALLFAEALANGPSTVQEELKGRLSFSPARRAMAAAQAILLIDSGLNLQVATDLASNPFGARRKRGQHVLQQVLGIPWRSQSRDIRTREEEVAITPNHCKAVSCGYVAIPV